MLSALGSGGGRESSGRQEDVPHADAVPPTAVAESREPRAAVQGAHSREPPFYRRSRRLFATTLTELKAIAALARTGLSSSPNAG